MDYTFRAGYEYHEAVSLYHIRNRVLHPELGRWTRRDPLGYVDGLNLYNYVESNPLNQVDPIGAKKIAISELTSPNKNCPPAPSEGCVVELRCNFMWYLLADHCYLVYNDSSGDCKMSRAGAAGSDDYNLSYPKKNKPPCGDWDKLGWGPFFTYSGPFLKDNPDYVSPIDIFNPVHKKTLATGQSACDLWDCVKDAMDKLHHCCIDYELTGPNSNSAIGTALRLCMDEAPGQPRLGVHGWNYDIDLDNCKRQR